jgi:hypothetical protein
MGESSAPLQYTYPLLPHTPGFRDLAFSSTPCLTLNTLGSGCLFAPHPPSHSTFVFTPALTLNILFHTRLHTSHPEFEVWDFFFTPAFTLHTLRSKFGFFFHTRLNTRLEN